jgi:gamma-glutamylcyclotransferase (GGCT)/AIG2-like uncharacterized protein YtfP
MTSLLFVYGSLMPTLTSAFGRTERTRLSEESTVIGPAHIAGRLFDLGEYPGLVIDGNASTEAHGVLLRLVSAEQTFAWLDAFEDIVPGRAADKNVYVRRLAPVTTSDGQKFEAWIYEIQHVPPGASEIASGRWRPPSE